MEGIGSVGFDFSGIVHVKITRKKKNWSFQNKFYLFIAEHLIDFRNWLVWFLRFDQWEVGTDQQKIE